MTGRPTSRPAIADASIATGRAAHQFHSRAKRGETGDVSTPTVYAPTAKKATYPRSSIPASPTTTLRPNAIRRNSPTLASTSDSTLPRSWGRRINITSTTPDSQAELRARRLGSTENSCCLILPSLRPVRPERLPTTTATARAAHHSRARSVKIPSATVSRWIRRRIWATTCSRMATTTTHSAARMTRRRVTGENRCMRPPASPNRAGNTTVATNPLGTPPPAVRSSTSLGEKATKTLRRSKLSTIIANTASITPPRSPTATPPIRFHRPLGTSSTPSRTGAKVAR